MDLEGTRAASRTAGGVVGWRRTVAWWIEGGIEFVLNLVVKFPLREAFADNLEHPDPMPLRLLPRGEVGALGPEDSNGESG